MLNICFSQLVWVFDYLDATTDCDHWWLPGRGGDGNGAHLVVKAVVVSIIHHKVEDISDWLAACL